MLCGVCSGHPYSSIVKFHGLKTEYSVDEDIQLDYVLHDVVQASTRDWIGIFPRGWSNFQQCLTFRYATVSPKTAASPNRSILFPRSFCREASLSTLYQFVYVSKEQQILGVSPYFRFIRQSRSYNCESACKLCHHCIAIGNAYTSSNVVNFNDDLSWRRPNRGSNVDQQRRTCPYCSAKKLSAINNRVNDDKLLAHIRKLERDLVMAETTLKQTRLMKTSLLNKLRAYETFVTEMLNSLTTKGTVKITDRAGKQITVQKVDPGEHESLRIHGDMETEPTEEDKTLNSINKESNAEMLDNGKSEYAESILLTDCKNANPDSKKRVEGLPIVDTNSPNYNEDMPDEIETSYRFVLGTEKSKSDIPVQELKEASSEQEVKEFEVEKSSCYAENANEEDQNAISGNPCIEEIKNVPKLTWNYPNIDNRDMEILPVKDDDLDDLKQWAMEFESEFAWPSEMCDFKLVPSIITADNTTTDNEDLSNNETSQTKPAAILIKGANVKFAIIRY